MPANEVVQHDSSGHMAYPAEASTADVYQDRCMEIDFPGKHMGMTRLLNRPTVAGPVAWLGSLVQDAQDASGLMYRRNRYYDPISSRFTQEDPIGLAGGVNSYGFAEGDPVSYSDPYGLKIECRTQAACNLWAALSYVVNRGLESRNRDVRKAARRLANLMNEAQRDKTATYIIDARDMDAREEQDDGGGLEDRTAPNEYSIWVDTHRDTESVPAGPMILLAHELGGAVSRRNGGRHPLPAARAENAARTLSGCGGRLLHTGWLSPCFP